MLKIMKLNKLNIVDTGSYFWDMTAILYIRAIASSIISIYNAFNIFLYTCIFIKINV